MMNKVKASVFKRLHSIIPKSEINLALDSIPAAERDKINTLKNSENYPQLPVKKQRP